MSLKSEVRSLETEATLPE